ncbi:MAG: hypothetical protein ACFFC7_13690 [Candidatus Hermodarchaeota archaeon]
MTVQEPSKQSSNRVERLNRAPIVLKVMCSAPIIKPLNGSLQKGSHLLKLAPTLYSYRGKSSKTEEEELRPSQDGKKTIKTVKTTNTYYIKGIRGAVHHKVMELCYQLGLEVCHTMERRKTKEDEKEDNTKTEKGRKKKTVATTRQNEIPQGFHALGECADNGGSCIVHKIFGSMRQESLIAVLANPIVSVKEKTAEFTDAVQRFHIATENRHAMSFEGVPLQDFNEHYFSGDFSFEIEVTLCTPEQLGLLINSAFRLNRLGRGYNAGYARVKVRELQLVERKTTEKLVWDEERQTYVVKEDIIEKVLKEEVQNALQAWDKYVEAHQCK